MSADDFLKELCRAIEKENYQGGEFPWSAFSNGARWSRSYTLRDPIVVGLVEVLKDWKEKYEDSYDGEETISGGYSDTQIALENYEAAVRGE